MEASGEDVAPTNPFDGGVKGRLYDALVAAEEPQTAAALAERADCEPAAVRECLQSFLGLGVALEHGGEPPTYEQNGPFFEWDHVRTPADEYSLAELETRREALLERVRAYQERFGVETPAAVDVPPSEREADPADWTAVRAELRRYDRARQIELRRDESEEID